MKKAAAEILKTDPLLLFQKKCVRAEQKKKKKGSFVQPASLPHSIIVNVQAKEGRDRRRSSKK